MYAVTTRNIPGMCRWKSVCGAIISVNLELLGTIHALKMGKALQRNFRGARDKLQEASSVRLVKGSEGPPEPVDL